MLSAFANSMKIPELRKRILFTLALIFICRMIALIPTPGVDVAKLQEIVEAQSGGLMGWLDLFSGGALGNFAVGSLGIWPYISASIILQLMTAVVPSLERMVREGESGRQKMQQYTRYLTLAICAFQAFVFAVSIERSLGLQPGELIKMGSRSAFVLMTILTFCTGTMMMMWLGEQITDRGIGNGISLVIMTNIVSRLPMAIGMTFKLFRFGDFSVWTLLALALLVFLVTMATVMLTQGVRRIPVHTARRSVGRKVYGGQTNYMPLRVNYSGVMPVIFAQPLIMFPAMILKRLPWPQVQWFGGQLAPGHSIYLVVFAIMILFFSYFWVATQFNPMRISDDLKRNQAYVPGIRPGKPTADFLDHTMTRLTLIGGLGLMVIAILPGVLTMLLDVPPAVTNFLGGTSLLIMVGVTLDTMRQIESHLLMRHYDGFLKKGHLRGRG